MIITKLKGGLGNQLFQYAIGRRLAEDQKSELKVDISLLNQQSEITTFRKYKLNAFNVNCKIATKADEKEVLGFRWLIPIKRRLWKMGFDLFGWNYFRETTYGYHPYILNFNKAVVLEGYWQSENYFFAIRQLLLNELTLKDELITVPFLALKNEMQDSNSVAIHVRRGDYVSNPVVANEFGICSQNYYLNAIQYMKEQLQNPQFYVFSDDLQWCKLNFKDDGYLHFVSKFEDYQDLMLISSCQHQIISNSTFSWWGAWLNKSADKIVVAPEIWYVDASFDTSQLIPLEWIRL